MSERPVVFLKLTGRHGPDGRVSGSVGSWRLVSVDLSVEEERGDIQRFYDPDADKSYWGLGTAEQGWWKITGAYELKDPTQDLHEGKYPVSYHLTDEQFDALIKEANK